MQPILSRLNQPFLTTIETVLRTLLQILQKVLVFLLNSPRSSMRMLRELVKLCIGMLLVSRILTRTSLQFKETAVLILTMALVERIRIFQGTKKNILKKLLKDLDRAYGNNVASNTVLRDKVSYRNWSKEEYIEMVNRGKKEFNVNLYNFAARGRIWFAGDYVLPKNGNQSGESGKKVAGLVFDALN